MKFIVDRSKWRSGGDSKNQIGLGQTYLKNKEGFMCCLGFCARQIGIEDILGIGEPSEIEESDLEGNILLHVDIDDGCYINSSLSDQAIVINDNTTFTQKERERRLRELFKKYGHQIVFKGKAVKPSKT